MVNTESPATQTPVCKNNVILSNNIHLLFSDEFIGWLKSFTKIERALTVLEAVLLVVLITSVILLILHLIVCSKPKHWVEDLPSTPSVGLTTDHWTDDSPSTPPPKTTTSVTIPPGHDHVNTITSSTIRTTFGSTKKPDVKCSWTPSAKTTAAVHYYENGLILKSNAKMESTHVSIQAAPGEVYAGCTHATPFIDGLIPTELQGSVPGDTSATIDSFEDIIWNDLSDGESADQEYEKHVVALVKLQPPTDIIFGCILTIISEFWTVTAASCIEAIEETDSLDSFVIMSDYGTDERGPLQVVDDVQVHPLYAEKKTPYDLAAVRSAGDLTGATRAPVTLASFLDYALQPLADKFVILGYGPFRSIERAAGGRRLRAAALRRLPAALCAGAALRHLERGRARARGACGAGALCAGVLYSRGLPCAACAGAPLLARGAAAALLAAPAPCGGACEPARAVNLAEPDVADWLRAVVHDHFTNP